MNPTWEDRSRALYERAMFGGDRDALALADRELDAVEGALCLARAKILHVRFLADRHEDPAELDLFERAALLYARVGELAGEGEAQFWIGAFHQVVRNDDASARDPLQRAESLASASGDRLTLSYVLRHQAFAASAADNSELAFSLMLQSTELRRELGFEAGVAANLVGLAYLSAQTGRARDVGALLDEAELLAARVHASNVLQWVADARAATAYP